MRPFPTRKSIEKPYKGVLHLLADSYLRHRFWEPKEHHPDRSNEHAKRSEGEENSQGNKYWTGYRKKKLLIYLVAEEVREYGFLASTFVPFAGAGACLFHSLLLYSGQVLKFQALTKNVCVEST